MDDDDAAKEIGGNKDLTTTGADALRHDMTADQGTVPNENSDTVRIPAWRIGLAVAVAAACLSWYFTNGIEIYEKLYDPSRWSPASSILRSQLEADMQYTTAGYAFPFAVCVPAVFVMPLRKLAKSKSRYHAILFWISMLPIIGLGFAIWP